MTEDQLNNLYDNKADEIYEIIKDVYPRYKVEYQKIYNKVLETKKDSSGNTEIKSKDFIRDSDLFKALSKINDVFNSQMFLEIMNSNKFLMYGLTAIPGLLNLMSKQAVGKEI
jgi:hypothetical protein